MVEQVKMRDLVVLLPGIMGSVLQKDGKDLFALSGSAAWGALISGGSSLQEMMLAAKDDHTLDTLGDGITAARLMNDAHVIPGFFKIDGYTAISKFIKKNFKVIHGSITDDKTPANFFEFPYDWRRDNRVAARLLASFIERRLKQWQVYTKNDKAKVILVAHSMGGLVSRYYLEVLEGWKDCRALVTFGTPFRGSPNALNFLSNGYKNRLIDLTKVLRSFTSAYQLLPIYPVIKVGGEYRRIAETDGVPNIDKARAAEARNDFHVKIMDAVESHAKEAAYTTGGYKIVPIVGTRQPTLQSAVLSNNKLEVIDEVPTDNAENRLLLAEGDGTVPRLSATPIELSDDYRETFFAERHASLQNNPQVLDDLYERLRQMQVVGLGKFRGSAPSKSAAEKPALSVGLEDLYFAGEPVVIRARQINVEADEAAPPKAHISSAQGDGVKIEREFQPEGDGWRLEVEPLPGGVYRLEVYTKKSGANAPPTVHDIFEVQGGVE